METKTLRILLFAQAAKLAGAREIEVQVEVPADLAAMRKAILLAVPELEALEKASRWAFQEEFVEEGFSLPNSDSILEVALIPPVSGG